MEAELYTDTGMIASNSAGSALQTSWPGGGGSRGVGGRGEPMASAGGGEGGSGGSEGARAGARGLLCDAEESRSFKNRGGKVIRK